MDTQPEYTCLSIQSVIPQALWREASHVSSQGKEAVFVTHDIYPHQAGPSQVQYSPRYSQFKLGLYSLGKLHHPTWLPPFIPTSELSDLIINCRLNRITCCLICDLSGLVPLGMSNIKEKYGLITEIFYLEVSLFSSVGQPFCFCLGS